MSLAIDFKGISLWCALVYHYAQERECAAINQQRSQRNIPGLTSSRCLTRLTKFLPSAAKPLTASTALDVL
jgi:hypothetical protein